jgi:hypothetical protein
MNDFGMEGYDEDFVSYVVFDKNQIIELVKQ